MHKCVSNNMNSGLDFSTAVACIERGRTNSDIEALLTLRERKLSLVEGAKCLFLCKALALLGSLLVLSEEDRLDDCDSSEDLEVSGLVESTVGSAH